MFTGAWYHRHLYRIGILVKSSVFVVRLRREASYEEGIYQGTRCASQREHVTTQDLASLFKIMLRSKLLEFVKSSIESWIILAKLLYPSYLALTTNRIARCFVGHELAVILDAGPRWNSTGCGAALTRNYMTTQYSFVPFWKHTRTSY
jgi:hypothetical protein